MEEEIFPEKKEEKLEKQAENTESVQSVTAADSACSVEETAQKFLSDIFQAMGMEVVITCQFEETENALDINLTGSDMGILIGKKGTDSGFTSISGQPGS